MKTKEVKLERKPDRYTDDDFDIMATALIFMDAVQSMRMSQSEKEPEKYVRTEDVFSLTERLEWAKRSRHLVLNMDELDYIIWCIGQRVKIVDAMGFEPEGEIYAQPDYRKTLGKLAVTKARING